MTNKPPYPINLGARRKIPKYISRWDIPDISWVQKCYVREGCNSKSLEFAMLWEYEKIAYESTLY